jgi:transposase InsO family protein
LATEKQINISAVCRQLGYSKQAYYKSVLHRKTRQGQDRIVLHKVLTVRRHMPRLGCRKLHHLLKEELMKSGLYIGRDKLFALLSRERLLVKRKKSFTRTTDSRHWMYKHPNLIKGLPIVRPEQVWVADITYVTIGNYFGYLHLVTDAYSKRIMGYHLSNNMRVENTIEAMQMAIGKRQYQTALIHHSDRGSQYCSEEYVRLLKHNHIHISMTQDGSPYDNAVAERVNGILKDEFGIGDHYDKIEHAAECIKRAIILYNEYRPHFSCSMLTPQEMHLQNEIQIKSWRKTSRTTLDSSSACLPSPPLLNQST